MWMKKMLNEGNQIHNSISSSGSGTVINYVSGSDILTSYGSGSISQKVTVSTVPVPVPQRCITVAVTSPRGWAALAGRPCRGRWWRCPGQNRAGQPPPHSHSCSPRSWNRRDPISTVHTIQRGWIPSLWKYSLKSSDQKKYFRSLHFWQHFLRLDYATTVTGSVNIFFAKHFFAKTHDVTRKLRNDLRTRFSLLFLKKNIQAIEQTKKLGKNVYPGYFRIFPISDPGFASKKLSILTQKLFLSSRKYDLGYSSRIRILIFLTNPDPGSRVQKGTGCRIRIRNTGETYLVDLKEVKEQTMPRAISWWRVTSKVLAERPLCAGGHTVSWLPASWYRICPAHSSRTGCTHNSRVFLLSIILFPALWLRNGTSVLLYRTIRYIPYYSHFLMKFRGFNHYGKQGFGSESL